LLSTKVRILSAARVPDLLWWDERIPHRSGILISSYANLLCNSL
jgi:hypothetical protein